MDWFGLITGTDPEALAEAVRAEFGVEIPPEERAGFLATCRDRAARAARTDRGPLGRMPPGGGSWSEASYRTFLKSLIAPYYPVGSCRDNQDDIVTAIFHIGFLGVKETDEQLKRLRDGPETRIAARVPRSKIARTEAIIRPINALADRVTDGNFRTPPGLADTPAARLRAARAAAGLTQREVADRLGVGKSYVADVESGRRQPSLDWLSDAAVAIGCDPSSLDPRLAPARP